MAKKTIHCGQNFVNEFGNDQSGFETSSEILTQPNKAYSVAVALSRQQQGLSLPSSYYVDPTERQSFQDILPFNRKGFDLADLQKARENTEREIADLSTRLKNLKDEQKKLQDNDLKEKQKLNDFIKSLQEKQANNTSENE